MSKEIIINADKELTRIAILEDGDLAELYFEDAENERTLGNIYLGRVRRIMPSIQAAFVDIGQKQDAFLHFSDLGDSLPDLLDFVDMQDPEIAKFKPQGDPQRSRNRRRHPKSQRGRKSSGGSSNDDGNAESGDKKSSSSRNRAKNRGKRRSAQRPHPQKKKSGNSKKNTQNASRGNDKPASDYLKRGQRILVKVVKEPISNKGSRVSTDISLAGRFLVLVPFGNYAAVSKRINSYKERRRLRALAKSLLPDGFGVIVRTVAQGKNAKTLDTDLRLLQEKWRKLEKKLAGKPEPPVLVHEDVNMASSIIRDLFSDDYDRILVDDQRLHRSIRSYVQAVAPQMANAVKLHQSKKPIFEALKIDRDVAQVFESRINLPSGGYLFLERTEAMHVIDVNSGRSGRGMNQEESSLKVNLEAARVLAKQIRLRDIGGIIVIDFIDLRSDKNRKKVYDELKKEFRKDRAVTKLLPMSDFGLIQITRQRLRPSITTTFSQPNGSNSSKQDDEEPPASEAKPSSTTDPVVEDPKAPTPQPVAPPDPEELVEELDAWISRYKAKGNRRAVTLCVHPFTAAFLNRRVPNHPTRWFMKHLVRVHLEADATLQPSAYRFVDPRSGTTLYQSQEKTAPDGQTGQDGSAGGQQASQKRSSSKQGHHSRRSKGRPNPKNKKAQA